MNPPDAPTWAACLTPPGRGALATLALHGPQAWEAVRALFRTRAGGELPPAPEPGRFWLGRLGDDVADEVVVAVRQARPMPWVEVHGHGGREVVRFLLELFAARGLRACGWQEFLRITGGEGLRAEAAIALAAATTPRTAAILLDQHQGALDRALEEVLALLEGGAAGPACGLLRELAGRGRVGRRLTRPWRVAVAGAPNVGKSSLVNALAGYQRSVVAPTPGTTRDVVTIRLAIDGWPVELADTAGLREGAGAVEAEGVRRARAEAAAADLCLWVLDAAAPPADADAGALVVVNKIDLPPAWNLDRVGDAVRVSARTGEGLADLCAALARRLVPEPPPPGAAVPFTERLASGVAEALRHAEAGRTAEAASAVRGLRPGSSRP